MGVDVAPKPAATTEAPAFMNDMPLTPPRTPPAKPATALFSTSPITGSPLTGSPVAAAKTRARPTGGPVRMISHYTGQREVARRPGRTELCSYDKRSFGQVTGGAWQTIRPG